jgi:hypothetical protein
MVYSMSKRTIAIRWPEAKKQKTDLKCQRSIPLEDKPPADLHGNE